MIRGALTFVAAMVVAPLPFRLWQRLPGGLQLKSAAFVAGILTLLAGAAIGIPGFLEHAAANVSMANAVQVATGPINRSLTQDKFPPRGRSARQTCFPPCRSKSFHACAHRHRD